MCVIPTCAVVHSSQSFSGRLQVPLLCVCTWTVSRTNPRQPLVLTDRRCHSSMVRHAYMHTRIHRHASIYCYVCMQISYVRIVKIQFPFLICLIYFPFPSKLSYPLPRFALLCMLLSHACPLSTHCLSFPKTDPFSIFTHATLTKKLYSQKKQPGSSGGSTDLSNFGIVTNGQERKATLKSTALRNYTVI